MRHLQPAVHLRADRGGHLPPHEPEGNSLWPRAAHLPQGADGAGVLLHRGGSHVLLLTQVGDHCGVKTVLLRAFFTSKNISPCSSLRLFHHPHLYKRFHKQHHEWTAPIGLVATYAHPLEHVVGGHRLGPQGSTSGHLAITKTNICSSSPLQLSNLLPVVIGPVILGSHVSTTCMWYCVALISTTISHCGYHLPFLPSPEFHDFHHLRCVHFSILFINFFFFFFFLTYTSALSWNQDNLQIWDLQQLPTFSWFPGSTSVTACSACWIVSTAQTTNSGRANSTSATCCWPASRLWTKASPIRRRRLSDGLGGSPHRPLDPL